MRFPELFPVYALQGVQIVYVPAARGRIGGESLAEGDEHEAITYAEIDMTRVAEARKILLFFADVTRIFEM